MSVAESEPGCHGDYNVTGDVKEENVISEESQETVDNYGAWYEIYFYNILLVLFCYTY